MKKTKTSWRLLTSTAAAVGLAAILHAKPLTAQGTTYYACYVPSVGAMYLIKLSGLPTACLSATHQQVSWIDGAAPADGSVTTPKLADGAVTSPKLAAGSVGTVQLADGSVTMAKLAASSAKLGIPHIVHAGPEAVPGAGETQLDVVCPTGEVVIGGGYTMSSVGLVVRQNFPSGAATWRVNVWSSSGTSIDLDAYAVCAGIVP